MESAGRITNSESDKRVRKSCSGVIEETAHTQSFSALCFNEEAMAADVILVMKVWKKSFVAISVVVETGDTLFKHHAEAHADFETAGIIRGCAVEGHGKNSLALAGTCFIPRGGTQVLLRHADINDPCWARARLPGRELE
jgi:hypothetical protein